MDATKFLELMKHGVISLFVLGLFLYSGFLIGYAFGWRPEFMANPEKSAYLFGLPICGLGAFALVCVLERFAPSKTDAEGRLAFKAFGLEFSGPAGPITLWIVCYLTLVASMQIVAPLK